MNILFLCKRHYMGHDVIIDKYARLYEIPTNLSKLGNNVLSICTSYRPTHQVMTKEEFADGSIKWIGNATSKYRFSLLYSLRTIKQQATAFSPDLVIASSDCIQIAVGSAIAREFGVPFVADLYDDYETFGLAKIPFVKSAYRKALKSAKIITCVSQHLKAHISKHYDTTALIEFLPSTINKKLFFPQSKLEARQKLNLPEKARIVGTAGGLTIEKGIDTVYTAMEFVAKKNPDIVFALAGPIDPALPPPDHPQFIYYGKLPHDKIGTFFSALDVGIVYIKNTQYGRLSFPQKAYEMAACEIPMVVTALGDLKYLMASNEKGLYEADNPISLALSITQLLQSNNFQPIQFKDWNELCIDLNKLLIRLL